MSFSEDTIGLSTIAEMEECIVKAIDPDLKIDPDSIYQICRRFSNRYGYPKSITIDVWKSRSDMNDKDPFISYTLVKNDSSEPITMVPSDKYVRTHIVDPKGTVIRVTFSLFESGQCPQWWISVKEIYEKFFNKDKPKKHVFFGELIFDLQSGVPDGEVIFTAVIKDRIAVNLVFHQGIVEVYLDDKYDDCSKVSTIDDLVKYLQRTIEGLDQTHGQLCAN